MRVFTQEQVVAMDFDTARAELANRVYEAAVFMEQLEGAGKVFGNGHHAAQQVSEFAVNNLRERWKESRG